MRNQSKVERQLSEHFSYSNPLVDQTKNIPI